MTPQTRRRVIVALFAIALTFPVEAVLVRAVSTDADQSIRQWVGSLSDTDLQAAADVIQDYPFAYRRAIMQALSPEQRSNVWRLHIQEYRDRPSTDSSAYPVLDAAIALASPSLFEGVDTGRDNEVIAVAEQLVTVVGRDDAHYLLYRLGPPDGTFASLEPLSQKLAALARRLTVVLARADDCNCNQNFGCDGPYRCKDGTGCEPVTEWPMCGWFWNQECNGTCHSIFQGVP
jgi:hypothetical protein